MQRFSNEIGIVQVDGSTLDEEAARRFAEQVSNFMVGVQKYYIEDLGLERTDPDPPPGDPGDIDWRIPGIQRSGPIEEKGLQFIGAFALKEDGTPSDEPDALKGLLILTKPKPEDLANGEQTIDLELPVTEIVEWDVAENLQGRGLGRTMLEMAVAGVRRAGTMILDVAASNTKAQAIYAKQGFQRTKTPPMQHGIFAVDHLRYAMPVADLQDYLHVTPTTSTPPDTAIISPSESMGRVASSDRITELIEEATETMGGDGK